MSNEARQCHSEHHTYFGGPRGAALQLQLALAAVPARRDRF